MEVYRVIGLMSGTSLDGLDIAECTFERKEGQWLFQLGNSITVPYEADWKKKLSQLENKSALELVRTHIEYGHLLGQLVRFFIEEHHLKIDFVASHGHTIFHQPSLGYTFQLGCGNSLAAECGLPVVFDFRSMDVALGGQGAPLVPMGDQQLFFDYTYCLNLGGFANLSYEHNGKRIAFDICPVNIILNQVCRSLGKEYDAGGIIARKGKVYQPLLNALNEIAYYHLPPHRPKSLGKEWLKSSFIPVFDDFDLSATDQLATLCEHIAQQIAHVLAPSADSRVLITGGGAYHRFLMERLQAHANCELFVPGKKLIEFKEALLFAFLGVLRWRTEENCLRSVTGASRDNVGGVIAYARKKDKL